MHRIVLVITISIIFALGLVMIFNTTSADVIDHALDRSTHQAMLKQIMYSFAGIFLGWSVWRVGYKKIISYSPFILFGVSFLLFLCLIPGIGREVNGARRWIVLMGVSLQPSEFIKYFVPAYFIYRLQGYGWKIESFKQFISISGVICIPIVLIFLEPNNGTVGVIAFTCAVLFVLAKVPAKYWAVPVLVVGLLGTTVAISMPYVRARLNVYWNPELDIKGKGHQPHQAKIAAGSGQLFGKGVGNSLQKLSYLPEAQNDYIAAIYAEEFGFIGILILITLYMVTALIGFMIAYQSTTLYGGYFAVIITFLISFQAFMNLGVVSGLLPSTGLNLPFFSQGGTSLIANMMGIGLLLSISCEANQE